MQVCLYVKTQPERTLAEKQLQANHIIPHTHSQKLQLQLYSNNSTYLFSKYAAHFGLSVYTVRRCRNHPAGLKSKHTCGFGVKRKVPSISRTILRSSAVSPACDGSALPTTSAEPQTSPFLTNAPPTSPTRFRHMFNVFK